MPTHLSIITAHFCDYDWTELLIRQLGQTTPKEVLQEIIVIDQDRSEASRKRLQALAPSVRVVQYPKSERHFAWTRHDHAAVLNQVLSEIRTDLFCIYDSDAHPIDAAWWKRCLDLLKEYDAVLTEDPDDPGFTHPCFMLLKQEHIKLGLAFDEGLFDRCIQTGRLIGQQLARAGQKVYYAPSRPAFSGKWGQLILDSVYHHGKGSFHGVNDPLLQSQYHWQNAFFRERVVAERQYDLSAYRHFDYHLRRVVYGLGRRVSRWRERAAFSVAR